MSDKQLPVLNVQPAKHTFCAYNNTYVLKGPHSFFMDGLKPDSSIINQARSSSQAALQDCKTESSPDMVFYGRGNGVDINGSDNVVFIGDRFKLQPKSKSDAFVDACSKSSDEKVETYSFGPDFAILPDAGTGLEEKGSNGVMSFVSEGCGTVVQGNGVCVVSGGNEEDAEMLSRLVITQSPAYYDAQPMEYVSNNCDLAFQGSHSKVFMAADNHGEKVVCDKSLISRDDAVTTTTCVAESDDSLSSSTPVPPAFARPCPVLSDSISDYANLEEVPVAKLSWKTRRHFSLLMDIEQVVAADWRMLADSFGFDCREISCMGREKSPSMCLLESLALRSITVGQLLEELLRLDRKDAVTELTEMVEKRMAQQVVVT